MRHLLLRPRAQDDLEDMAAFLARDNEEAALRFLDAVRAALDRLVQTPAIGAPHRFSSKRLIGVRVWPVPGFPNHLVFYRAAKGSVEVIRILHGARDIRSLLEET